MLRKNVASQFIYFTLVNATNGAALTGATVTARTALGNAAQAAATGTTSELGNGHYRFNLSQADTNADFVGYLFTASNAIPVSFSFITTGGNFADAVRFGLTALPNAAAEAAGGLYTRGTGAGQVNQNANGGIDVNVTHAAGTAWASGAITAASIAADAITDTKIATGALTFAKFATGAIKTMVWDNVQTTDLTTAGSAGKLLVDNLNAAVSSRATPAQVNTEVLDVITVDTFAPPGQEAPAATTTIMNMVRYMYKFSRNKLTNDGTDTKVFADDGSTVDHKAPVSESAGVVTRGEFISGP